MGLAPEKISVGGSTAERGLDVGRIREDFPILGCRVHDRPLVYLDNAATSQKPQAVLDAMSRFYSEDYANIHRGVHWLSQRATGVFEEARAKVAGFLGATHTHEIIFVRGATEGINLVANSFARPLLKPGDEILITGMEHHSNIVPWQMVCEATGARLRVIPITDRGGLAMDEVERLIGPQTRLVAVTHLSNALGTINPIRKIVELAHAQGVAVLVDGAQSAAHLKVDVAELGCDFLVFSGHKLYGPTGIGVLYGKNERLEAMEPYQGGGDMISSVTFEKTTYNELPYKFEAGTPHIAGAVGLGAAIDYVGGIGLERIVAYENELLAYATGRLLQVPGLSIIGTAPCRASVLSFVIEGIHPHDIGTIVDRDAIAIRTGHHCAQPVMDRFGLAATARASLAFYNTKQEIDALVASLFKVKEMLA